MENDKLTFREGVQLSYDIMYDLLNQQRELPAMDIITPMQELFNELLDNYDEVRSKEIRKHFDIDKNWSSKYLKEKIDSVVNVEVSK